MRFCLFLFIFFLIFTNNAQAQSSYVLPYPSYMPGNSLYKINLIKEELLEHWYFGSLSKFKYDLKLADKYLVEAKTLFEYKQYLLGVNALNKSDKYFVRVSLSLSKADREGKKTSSYRVLLKEASLKHTEVLGRIKEEVPESFNWEPEKSKNTMLHLKKEIEQSEAIRSKYQ